MTRTSQIKKKKQLSFACFFIVCTFIAILVLSAKPNDPFCHYVDNDKKFTFFSSNPQATDSNFILCHLEHILQAQGLGVIEKLLQKCESTFSEGVLAVIDVVLALTLLSCHQWLNAQMHICKCDCCGFIKARMVLF